MSEAKTILKMIEEVDPSDTDKLDEIDIAVAFFVGEEMPQYKTAKYTRSRDALKSIRPEGWCVTSMNTTGGGFSSCQTNIHDPRKALFKIHAPTEELAELHAIIQAIEWERSQ